MVALNANIYDNPGDVVALSQGEHDRPCLPPPTLQASLFGRFWGAGAGKPSRKNSGHMINLGYDSWIICFTGSRGSGKTTLMTLMAIKEAICNGRRVISSYPIEFNCLYPHNGIKHFNFEILDWEKLLTFDDEYKNCLLLLDEAPDALSNLASMTWKNRLVNIFVRQIRKNRNSLFLAAQHIDLIDKSLRWQVDVEMTCQDASRRYGWSPDTRGKVILGQALDCSGQWTGQTWQERARYGGAYGPNFKFYPRVLWGVPGKTKPAYDTYYVTDIWESLSKVDMKLSKRQIGPGASQTDNSELYHSVAEIISSAKADGSTGIYSREFYQSLGELSPSDKNAISKRMQDAGAVVRRSGDRRYYDIQNFDINKFNERN